MRKVLPVLAMLGVAACAAPTRWEKPGASAEMVEADMVSCRQAAMQEANRYVPFGVYPGAYYGWGFRTNWTLWQIRQDNDRFYAEHRLAAFCMRTKGYEQVEVRQPPAQAPPVPSPEPK
jgi:hypothetical protein